MSSSTTYVQGNQPDGVPPLELTGERTLPDVPEENYWFQRHLVVYEWIAARCANLRVIDLACGEGYGSEVLGRTAASVTGVDANPEAYAHAAAKYSSDTVQFERALIGEYQEPCDAVVFLQTIEHVENPGEILEHIKAQLQPGGVAYVSTPNVITLAPDGKRSGNPWHVYEYRPEEFDALCREHFSDVEISGVFHARKLRAQDVAIRLGWDRVHPKLRITRPFYGWFVPAIEVGDFTIRQAPVGDLHGALDLIAVLRA